MAVQYANGRIITDGLVLNLNAADQNSYPGSGTTWSDTSGNSNTGTLTNGPTFNSANGGIILFDGVDDYGSVTNTASLRPSTELTVSMWLKAAATTPVWKKLWGQDPYSGGYLIFLESDGTLIRALHYVSSTEYRCNTSTTISTTVWKQAVFTFKTGDAIRSYFNGVAGDGTVSLPAGTFNYNTSNPWLFGTVGGGYYNGYIANVLIYNRALSATEISQNYNAQKSRFGLK